MEICIIFRKQNGLDLVILGNHLDLEDEEKE